MLRNKAGKKLAKAILAGVRKEMANPRVARSAKIAELNLDTTRTPEQPSATVPGTVEKLIPSSHPNRPEKAQIGVDGPDRGYHAIRIENSLTDEDGDDVRLKKGAQVDVTVTAKSKK